MEILCELLLELVPEFLADPVSSGFLRAIGWDPTPRALTRVWVGITFALVAGYLPGDGSLHVLWHPLSESLSLRVCSFLLSPVACGLCMAALGRRRTRLGRWLGPLHRFTCGRLLALAVAICRFLGAACPVWWLTVGNAAIGPSDPGRRVSGGCGCTGPRSSGWHPPGWGTGGSCWRAGRVRCQSGWRA